MYSYAEAMMVQMFNRRMLEQRCVKCEMEAEAEIERKREARKNKKSK